MKISVALALLVCGASACAFETYSNMPQTNDDAISADLTELRRKAMGFTTDNQTYEVSMIQARMALSSSTSYPWMALYTSVAGTSGPEPGALIEQLGVQLTINPGVQTIFFAPPMSPLAANTSYWIVMGGGTETYDWRGSLPGITPTGFATHLGSVSSTDGGQNWSSDSVLNSINIIAEPVPEPGTFMVLGLLSVGFLLRRRK